MTASTIEQPHTAHSTPLSSKTSGDKDYENAPAPLAATAASRPSMNIDPLDTTRPSRPSVVHIQEPISPSRGVGRTFSPIRNNSDSAFHLGPGLLPTLSNEAILMAGPPPLNYTLRTRKLWIAAFWSLIVIDCIGVPIALYFGLWYGTTLSPNAVFSISTACLGGVSIVEYVLRFWRLFKKGSTCRVLGARRSYLDWFHWNFSAGWFFVMAELIVGTVFTNPPIRLLAMPVVSMLWWFALQTLLEDLLRYMGKTSPVRISSMPKGSRFRPGIYSIIEDVVAVDGSGGTRFRKRLNDRYEASHYFRQMLHRLTLFWSFGALATAILTTILIFTIQREAGYVLGWVLPFFWAGLWTPPTFWYVGKCLKQEKEEWLKVVQAEGLHGLAKWQTQEPRVRLLSVAAAAGETRAIRRERMSVDLQRRNSAILRGVGHEQDNPKAERP